MSSSIVDCITQFQGIAKNQNVLHKHVAFFHINNDGIVYPRKTYQGLRAIGCSIPLSFAAAIFINHSSSGKTLPGKFPSLLFPIKGIQIAKHGSADSGVYDSEGRIVGKKFEEIFSMYALTNPDSLTWRELKTVLNATRKPMDFIGWFTRFMEWKILFGLCKNREGLLTRDTVRAVYDGSLFETITKEHASARKKGCFGRKYIHSSSRLHNMNQNKDYGYVWQDSALDA